jgi:hypothetical protein
MGSLQEELKKKVLQPKKEKQKEEAEKKSQEIKKQKQTVISGPRTIKCRNCGLQVRVELLKQHNDTVHNNPQFLANKIIHKKEEALPKGQNISVHSVQADGHKMTVIRQVLKEESKNSASPSNTLKAVEKEEIISIKSISNFYLSSNEDFKIADEWVYEQCPSTESKEIFDIRIGLDFGTSYTKASIFFGGDIYIVSWEGITHFKDKYTLPTEFSLFANDTYEIGRSFDAVDVFTNLKGPFLEESDTGDDEDNATIYLAMVLRYIRAWWFKRYKNQTLNKKLHWLINVGSPSKDLGNVYLEKKYKKIINTAWSISQSTKRLYKQIIQYKDGVINIDLVPEFVAQISSYTRSAQRQSDLHLLVDIGAGTVDVVTFNVHQDESGDDNFPEFASDVKRMGTHYLMYKRNSINANKDLMINATVALDSVNFSKQYGVDLTKIKQIDDEHAESVAKLIKTILGITKSKRYALSRNWGQGIRTFFCGGGASCSVFIDALEKTKEIYKLLKINLPLPERLINEDIDVNNFHRVSVAYGLAFDSFNLGQVISKHKIEDAPRPELPMRKSNTDFEDG